MISCPQDNLPAPKYLHVAADWRLMTLESSEKPRGPDPTLVEGLQLVAFWYLAVLVPGDLEQACRNVINPGPSPPPFPRDHRTQLRLTFTSGCSLYLSIITICSFARLLPSTVLRRIKSLLTIATSVSH